MRKHLFWVILLLAGFCQQAWAQDRSISGKITDRTNGQGLPGVTIIVKDAPTIGTSTNADGAYSLSVPSTAKTLVFSFVGYATQEVAITGNTISIALATDTKQLNEVVVTALGVERNRNSLAFAATQVDGGDITVARNPNPVNGLEGKVAGLAIQQSNTMGGSSNVIIRGAKSLLGNNQALFVVDGVPISNQNTNSSGQQTGRSGYDYGNAAADINPDDIATTTVLKGAAATALYGERAANGVILITTKKGRRSGLGVTINTGITFGRADMSTFIKYQKEYGAGYGQIYGPDENSYFNRDASGALVVPTGEDASYGGRFDPSLLVRQWYSYVPGSPTFGQATPWTAAANDPSTFFQTAISNLNSITIDGGSEMGNFKLGYSGNNEQGYLPNSRIKKDVVNFAGSLNLTPRLTFSSSVNFSRVKGLGRYGTGYGSENVMTNFRQWWQTNVDIKELKSAYDLSTNPDLRINNGNASWNMRSPQSGDLRAFYWNNPYFVRYNNYEEDTRYRLFGNVTSTYKIADWFDVLGRVSLDSYDEMQEERSALGSTTASYLPYYSRYNHTYREYNFDLFGNFKAAITPSISFRGLLGTNLRRISNASIFAQTNGGLAVPNLYSLTNTISPINPPSEVQYGIGVDGVFANATFGYLDRVFLDLTIRRDKSTVLPEGNNTYYYPSVALGYVFSESLKEKAPWLSYGKVRANFAQVGSASAPQAVYNYYNKPVSFGTVPLFALPTTLNNSGLKNETTRSYELGVETSFLQSRIGFEATVYQQNSSDQLLAVSIPASTGYLARYVNAGELRNRGIEVSAFVTPVQTSNVKWTINANWTKNENKLISLYSGDNLVLATYQQGVSSNATIGQAYGSLRGTDFTYDAAGRRIVGDDGYYVQTADANNVIGNPTPRWRGGITNTITYKSVSLNFLVDIKSGGQIYSLDRAYGLDSGLQPETAGLNDLGNQSRLPIAQGGGVILPGVKADGTPNDVRIENNGAATFGYNYNPNAAFVYDASFVKLREAALTFTLPANLLSKIAVKGIDFSIVGRNLWIIHKNLPDADPEDIASSGNLGQGFQGGAYPSMRTLGANLRLRF